MSLCLAGDRSPARCPARMQKGTGYRTLIDPATLAFLRSGNPATHTHRNPRLLVWFVGWFLLRFERRVFLGLLFQPPPPRTEFVRCTPCSC